MKINDITSAKKNIEISKELEIINFRILRDNQHNDDAKEGSIKHWILEDSRTDDKATNKGKNQFTLFQNSMKIVIMFGLCIGINPVTGILQKDVSKIRFTVCSWKFLYAIAMTIFQLMGTSLSVYKLFTDNVSLTSIGFVAFYVTALCTTAFFIRIATKWPTLLSELSTSGLDEYVDSNVIKKCRLASIAFIGMSILENTLSQVSRVANMLDCSVNITDYGKEYIRLMSPWFYDLNVPHSPALAVFMQFINLTSTAMWNYADMFIVCISLYLTSILKQIYKKIALTANKNYLPIAIWAELRKDYTRATRLVKVFDEHFSSIVFVAFANDLFFICLQLFNILANRVRSIHFNVSKECPFYPSGPFHGYEYPIYVTYSVLYLFIRFLVVALMAAEVHSASLMPAPVLYSVPSRAYTKEVERFLSQVNGDTVALSGLQFFYITRELVLSAAGTIVTYELVLLQFNIEDLGRK